jgi:hypothetical protein
MSARLEKKNPLSALSQQTVKKKKKKGDTKATDNRARLHVPAMSSFHGRHRLVRRSTSNKFLLTHQTNLVG